MEVNRLNYEMFIVDYLEGNLPKDIEQAVLAFLKLNPDIETEINSLTEYILTPELIQFENKKSLKKNLQTDIPGLSKFQQLSIAYLEEDISKQEYEHLNLLLKNSKKNREEHKYIQKTKIKPDISITYPNKKELKHAYNSLKFSKSLVYIALAASIILFIGIRFILSSNNHKNYSTAIAYTKIDIQGRQISEPTSQKIVPDSKELMLKTKKIEKDTALIRNYFDINTIELRQITQIEQSFKTENISVANLIFEMPAETYQTKESEFESVQVFLNNKLKEKVLGQDKNEKISVISVANAFGKLINKLFHKNLKVEKTINQDGTLLYAIKTDSFDFYSKIKPREKRKQNNSE